MNKAKSSGFIKFKNYNIIVKITLIVFFLFFLIEAILQLYPFVWVINNALKGDMYYETTTALTKEWRFVNFLSVFNEFICEANGEGIGYLTMLWNSIWQTAVYLFVNIGSSVLLAYALAKFRFPGAGFLFGLLIFKQTIPIIGTGVAAFKLRYALGMINNPYTIWINWANGFDYSAFVIYGVFKGISMFYTESAKLDGASDLNVFLRIVLPQAFPVIVALLVTNFVTKWNDYATTQISLWNYPNLAYGLFSYRKSAAYAIKGVYYAAVVMVSLPGVILYWAFQNLIINNISVGGLKG